MQANPYGDAQGPYPNIQVAMPQDSGNALLKVNAAHQYYGVVPRVALCHKCGQCEDREKGNMHLAFVLFTPILMRSTVLLLALLLANMLSVRPLLLKVRFFTWKLLSSRRFSRTQVKECHRLQPMAI